MHYIYIVALLFVFSGSSIEGNYIVFGNDDPAKYGATVVWDYDVIDGFAVIATDDKLRDLNKHFDVYEDRIIAPHLAISASSIGAPMVWASGFTGQGITVAVIDSGIDYTHPAFRQGFLVGCMAILNKMIINGDCFDSYGHGTHVSGIIAANNGAYRGIAPGANIFAIRVLHAAGAGLTSDTLKALDWIYTNGNNVVPPIKVVNLSLGPLDPGCGNDSSPEAQAVNRLVEKGIVVVVSAGNEGGSACTIDGAAAARGAITVAASNHRNTITMMDDDLATFSSLGSPVGYLKPDITFPGVSIVSAYLAHTYRPMSGTSMSAPMASGTVALMLQKNPNATPYEIKDTVLNNAVKNPYTTNSPNRYYGYGLGSSLNSVNGI